MNLYGKAAGSTVNDPLINDNDYTKNHSLILDWRRINHNYLLVKSMSNAT